MLVSDRLSICVFTVGVEGVVGGGVIVTPVGDNECLNEAVIELFTQLMCTKAWNQSRTKC